MDVGRTLYNVEFVDGSCVDLFNGCDEASDFIFHSSSDAYAGAAARPMPDGAKPISGGWNRVVITVTDLPALVARLRKDGYRFRNDIVTGPGGSQILVEDPSGNPLELFESAKSN